VAYSQFLPVASINAGRSCGNLARRIPHAEAVRRIHVASHLSHHNAAATTLRHPRPHTNAKNAPAARDVHTRAHTRTRALTHRVSPSRQLPRHGITGLEDSHLPNCVPVFILRRDLFRLRDACTRNCTKQRRVAATRSAIPPSSTDDRDRVVCPGAAAPRARSPRINIMTIIAQCKSCRAIDDR